MCYFLLQHGGTNTNAVPEVPSGKFEVPEIFMVSFDAVFLHICIPSLPGRENEGKRGELRFILSLPVFLGLCLWSMAVVGGSVDFSLSLVLQRVPTQLLRAAGSILGICYGVLQEGDLQNSLQCGHASMEGLKMLEKWDLRENFCLAGCPR